MFPDATKRVMVVEDDRILGDVLQRSLQRAGLKVTLAKNGLEACDYLAERFDLVVTDYQMPKMNGEEFVRKLRQDPSYADVPVIFVTGKGLELDTEQLRGELGIYEFISKPFGPRRLIDVIHCCLEQDPELAANRSDGS